jgi:thiamine pyrophosphokinase
MEHTVALIANGAIQDPVKTAALVKTYSSVIAVDGGLVHCAKMGIMPDLLVGDLDSIPDGLLESYPDLPIRRFSVNKDETDLELALQGIYTPEVAKVTIFGGLEKRTDHLLANLNLLRRYPGKVFLENENELIFVLMGSNEIPCRAGQTISFMPLADPTTGVTSEGLKWELHEATFSKYFFSLSNICLSNRFNIKLQSGDLLCCMQK